jgi:orotidine-5'-phosphate decarboxylase
MKYEEFFRHCLDLKKTFLCVGVDPDPEQLPAHFPRTSEGVYQFCKNLIDVTHDLSLAYKFNLAFFEIWGAPGWQILGRLLAELPPDVMTIGDAKRGDIGNSSRFYVQALFDTMGFNAATVSPYLGSESYAPFCASENHGAFVLCVTSNPSSLEIQEHGQPPLYLKVAEKVQEMNRLRNLGLVMGATKPEQLTEIRQRFPSLPFLIPGIGKQGGTAALALEVCRACGTGLINVSRSISFPETGKFPENIREATQKYSQQFQI